MWSLLERAERTSPLDEALRAAGELECETSLSVLALAWGGAEKL
jgi:hypothetical protein